MKPKNFQARKLKRRLVAQNPGSCRKTLFDLYAEDLEMVREIRSKKYRGKPKEASN